ncbi:MAG TPA: hypothetical protein VGT79_05485, partial [Xanthomonadaceae bacterium]|nr:hypothetical protein [Xanthomonadaceae bacterium]
MIYKGKIKNWTPAFAGVTNNDMACEEQSLPASCLPRNSHILVQQKKRSDRSRDRSVHSALLQPGFHQARPHQTTSTVAVPLQLPTPAVPTA